MRLLYDKVYNQICKVDFNKIWDDFHAYPFALYNNESVYLKGHTIAYEECFIGNTSIKYDGEQIAIWKVEDYTVEDPVCLAADIIHEMFHAYQYEMNESRFPNDIEALDYPINLDNYVLKYAENIALVNSLKISKAKEKMDFLSSFISSRRKREEIIGSHINYEYLIETVEGTAEYVSLMALQQLDIEKYDERIDMHISKLFDIEKTLFDTRRLSYYSGSILLIALSQANIRFDHDISREKETVFRIISRKHDTSDLPPVLSADEIKNAMNMYLAGKKKLFDDFFSKNPKCIESLFTICGYDPMNMIKYNDLVWCRYFIMLKTKTKDEPLFLNGPLVIKIDKSNPQKVLSYHTL